MLSIALALAACSAQPTPLSTPTSTPEASLTHPTDANVVILRLEDGGGIMPMELFATHAPTFSLYGDGTAVYQPIDTRAGDPVGGLLFAWLCAARGPRGSAYAWLVTGCGAVTPARTTS